MRYAVVAAGVVVNVVRGGDAGEVPPDWVALPDDSPVGPGWRVVEGVFRAPDAPVPVRRMLGKLAFRDLVVSVAGLAAYEGFRGDPALFLVNDQLNLASEVDPADMPAALAAGVARGHLTDADVAAIMAAWPVE